MTKMAMCMRAIMWMIKDKAMAFIRWLMEITIKVTGKMMSIMEMDSYKDLMDIDMKVTGSMVWLTGKERKHCQMARCLMEHLYKVKSMGMEH